MAIPEAELTYTASRASGPGGQHVNTADTRIQLRWNLRRTAALTEEQKRRVLRVLASRLTEDGDLLLACATHRSQRRNRDEVSERLAELVRDALVPPRPRKRTRPSRAVKARRREAKRRRSQVKRSRRRSYENDD